MPSDDVLRSVAERLPVAARCKMAQLSKKHYLTFGKWDDVTLMIIDEDRTWIIGETFSARIGRLDCHGVNFIDRLLYQCPRVNKIVAQCMLHEDDVKAISRISSTLRHFSIANLNYRVSPDGSRSPLFTCSFPRLRSLNILPRLESTNRPQTQLTIDAVEKLFSPSLVKLRLNGIALRNEVLEKIFTLSSLRILDLGGCLVDSLTAQKVIHFDKLPELESLSLPASLFSLHRPINGHIDIPFSLKSLAKLETLTMHCETINEDLFVKCLEKFFPKNLKTLRLTGHTINEPKTCEWQSLKMGFKIERIQSNAATIKRYEKMPELSKLIRESFWCHPYRQPSRFIILRQPNQQSIVTAETWQVAVPEVTRPLNPRRFPTVRRPYGETFQSPGLATTRLITPPGENDRFRLDEGLLEHRFGGLDRADSAQAIAGSPIIEEDAPQIGIVDQLLMALRGAGLLQDQAAPHDNEGPRIEEVFDVASPTPTDNLVDAVEPPQSPITGPSTILHRGSPPNVSATTSHDSTNTRSSSTSSLMPNASDTTITTATTTTATTTTLSTTTTTSASDSTTESTSSHNESN